MKQQTLAMASGFERYGKKTRRTLFLEEMEQVVPWVGIVWADRTGVCQCGQRAAAGGSGTNAADLFFAAMVQPVRPWGRRSAVRFGGNAAVCGIDLGREPVPDETAVCKFRHLLEQHGLGERLSSESANSGEETEGAAELGGQTGRTASGVREPAAGAGRLRQAFTAAARRTGRAELRALLRDGRDAALSSARTGKHSEAATDPRGCTQSQP